MGCSSHGCYKVISMDAVFLANVWRHCHSSVLSAQSWQVGLGLGAQAGIGGGCRRTHQSLASVGVAALVRLVTSAGSHMSSSMWQEAVDMVAQAAADTIPQVADLVTPPPRSLPCALFVHTFLLIAPASSRDVAIQSTVEKTASHVWCLSLLTTVAFVGRLQSTISYSLLAH